MAGRSGPATEVLAELWADTGAWQVGQAAAHLHASLHQVASATLAIGMAAKAVEKSATVNAKAARAAAKAARGTAGAVEPTSNDSASLAAFAKRLK